MIKFKLVVPCVAGNNKPLAPNKLCATKNLYKKMVKKIILAFMVVFATAIHTKGQQIEIIPQTNYTFGGKIFGQFGELKIENSASYGISLNIVRPNVSFQIEYHYQPTTGLYRDYFAPDQFNQNANLRIGWYQVGIRRRFNSSGKVVPFGGLSLGLTTFDLDSKPTSYDEVALSLGLQGGVNVYLTDFIGLRFHTRLLMPIQFNGFGFTVGTNGVGVGATAGTYFLQADIGAGVVFRLPNGN